MTIKKIITRIRKWDWSPASVLRTAGSALIIIVALAIVLFIFSALKTFLFGGGSMTSQTYSYDGYGRNSITSDFIGEVSDVFSIGGMGGGIAGESVKMMAMDSAAIMPMYDEGGADAEEYERHSYSNSVETSDMEGTCGTVEALKPLEYVVFDSSNASDRSCNFSFRVEVAYEQEIADIVRALDPENFSASITTMENTIENNDNEIALLKRRIVMLEDTIDETEAAYSELLDLATNQRDASSLATIINNKINTINSLTQQKSNAQDRLDRLTRTAAGAQEQIEYAHFNVYVSKRVFFDWENLANSWRNTLEELIAKVNVTLIALSLGLLTFVLTALQFVVYAALLILLATVFLRALRGTVRFIWHWKR